MSSVGRSARSPTPGAVEYALLAGVSLAWGTSYMFTKISVGVFPPFTLISLRTVIAASVMIALTLARGLSLRMPARDIAAFALVGLTANAAPLCLIAISVSHVDSSVTATTQALVPLIIAFFAIFRGEYPTTRSLIGIAVGLVGIAVLFGPEAFVSFGDSARGAAAAVAAAFIFAGSLFLMALVRRHDPMVVTAGSLTAAALWTIPFAFFVDGVPDLHASGIVLGAVLVLSLFNTAASNLMMFALVPRAGATFTSYNNYLAPAVAVLCGAVFLGEPLTLRGVLGVVLVLAGVAISTIKRRAPIDLPPIPPVV